MAIKRFLKTEWGLKFEKEPTQIVVREQLGEPITFTITFSEDVCEGNFQLLKHPAFNPLRGIEIYVEIDEKAICLVKGFVQGHSITYDDAGGAQFQVSGSDNSAKLDWVTKNKTWNAEKWGKELDKEEIKAIFKNDEHTFNHYSIFENVKKPEPEKAKNRLETIEEEANNQMKVELPFQKKIVQSEGDLAFLKRLAREYGMYVWVSYNDEGEEIAHFDKLPLESTPVIEIVELKVNGENKNIEGLSVNLDANRPTSVESNELDVRTKNNEHIIVPEPTQHKLSNMTLKMLTGSMISTHISGPPDNVGKRRRMNEAALDDAEWFINASCSTSYDRLCAIIHAHTIVNVLGAGTRHSGYYLVSGLTHTIDNASYKMQIELKRNAWTHLPEDTFWFFKEEAKKLFGAAEQVITSIF